MGADLYIKSLHDASQAKYRPLFEAACAERDKHDRDSLEAKAAQKDVREYCELMHGAGYFRDSYNSTSIMWRYGLSWGQSDGLIDEEGMMSPTSAKALLEMLESYNMKEVTAEEFPDDLEGWRSYFETKATLFKNFLRRAIELNEPIVCSC